PEANYNGEASFSYTVSDGNGGTDTATVTLNVDSVNDAISVVTDTDTSANIVAENVPDGTSTGVTLNATDADGDAITYSVADGVPFTVNSDGTIVTSGSIDYETTPSYTFDVTATSADGTTSTESITINVSDIVENIAPEATDDIGSGTGAGTVLVSENFEDGATGWSDNTVTQAGGNVTDFLGQFGGTNGEEGVSKTFDFGAEHAGETVTIEFDMYEIDSWDNEQFNVFVNGDEVSGISYDYNVNNATDGGTDLDTVGTADWFSWSNQDESHHYTMEAVVDENGQVQLGFGSTLNQDIGDESWGIDNVTITAGSNWSGGSITTDEDSSIIVDALANDTDVDGDTLSITQING
ncbi:MAG: cadherin-like domain-containing protein, partial [Arcobacteraceae bacterium]|nr:cadherin-like domain-containing protein [Arcobacteraceae bacterium]